MYAMFYLVDLEMMPPGHGYEEEGVQKWKREYLPKTAALRSWSS
jgi:hypothetical protein